MSGKWMTWLEGIEYLKCQNPDMLDYVLAGTLTMQGGYPWKIDALQDRIVFTGNINHPVLL